LADVAKIRGQRSEVRDEFPARVSAPRLEGVEIENKSTSYSNSNRVEGAAAARSGGAAGTDTRGRVCSPEADAAAAYIGEKLALPSMLHVLKEVTGGVEHMRLKFSWLMDHKPERLAELIGEAATPEVRQKARWLNAAMRKEMAV
jgi:hypothetical protein